MRDSYIEVFVYGIERAKLELSKLSARFSETGFYPVSTGEPLDDAYVVWANENFERD